eukprot:gene1591-968_t
MRSRIHTSSLEVQHLFILLFLFSWKSFSEKIKPFSYLFSMTIKTLKKNFLIPLTTVTYQ